MIQIKKPLFALLSSAFRSTKQRGDSYLVPPKALFNILIHRLAVLCSLSVFLWGRFMWEKATVDRAKKEIENKKKKIQQNKHCNLNGFKQHQSPN